jgi:hypothetical protein
MAGIFYPGRHTQAPSHYLHSAFFDNNGFFQFLHRYTSSSAKWGIATHARRQTHQYIGHTSTDNDTE